MRIGDLTLSQEAGVLVAAMVGEIDLSNASDIAFAITDATSNDALGVVLDLTEVEYLDSAGIQLLFLIRDSLSSRGQKLTVVVTDESLVAKTFELANISSQITIAPTLNAALESFP